MWVPRTDVKGSGSRLPAKTPSASDAYTGNMKKDEFKFGNSGSLAQEVESGFLETHRNWPTPTASDTEGGIAKDVEERDGTFSRVNAKGERWGVKLRDAVDHAEKMWPTQAAHEGRLGYQRRDPGKKGTQKSLSTEVIDEAGGRDAVGGQLNPTWVEWLMGWPLGWTDLKPLETDKYQQWLQQHGKS